MVRATEQTEQAARCCVTAAAAGRGSDLAVDSAKGQGQGSGSRIPVGVGH